MAPKMDIRSIIFVSFKNVQTFQFKQGLWRVSRDKMEDGQGEVLVFTKLTLT